MLCLLGDDFDGINQLFGILLQTSHFRLIYAIAGYGRPHQGMVSTTYSGNISGKPFYNDYI